MNESLDLSNFLKVKNRIFDLFPYWAFYKREIPNTKQSYLLYQNQIETKCDIFLNTKCFAFKWEMPRKFVTEKHRFEFTIEKLKLGIFRFPINLSGSKVDFLLSDPGRLTSIENAIELLDSEIITFDTHKINLYYFELDEITDSELNRVQDYWQRQGLKEVKKEINLIKKFMNANFKKALNEVEQKIKLEPDYLFLLKMVLDKKMTAEEAQFQSNNVITNFV